MFSSVEDIKEYILKELCNEFPRAATVDVGYYDGRQSSKIWLVSKEDLQHMYSSVCKHGEIAEYINEVNNCCAFDLKYMKQ